VSRYDLLNIELDGALQAAQGLSDVPSRILRAQQRALATLGRRLPVQARRDIQAEYNLKAGRITQGLRLRNAADGLVLVGSARGINALQFGATWSRRMKGARFTIKRGGDRSAHEGSFIATGKNGNRLVFERKGTARLPIQAVYGPSVGQMLKHGRRPERLAEFAIRTLQAEQQRLLGSKP
jgi:hypothetical protein